MPDQLVYTTISALLRISTARPDYRTRAFAAILKLVEDIVDRLSTMDGVCLRAIVMQALFMMNPSVPRANAARPFVPWVLPSNNLRSFCMVRRGVAWPCTATERTVCY